METLIYAGLMNAAIAAVLAVIVAGLAMLLRRRPAVVHGLWVLVLVKFLTPSVLPVEVPWWRTSLEQPGRSASIALSQNPAPEVAHLDQSRDFAEEFSPAPLMQEPLPREILPPADESLTLASVDPPISSEPGLAPIAWSWKTLVGMVWLTGSLVWIAVAAVRIVRFQRILRLARPVDPEVQARVRQLAERLGLSNCPSVAFVSAPSPPMLWALTRSPWLLIPWRLWERLSEEQRDTLLVHELAHLRRGDHWVRRLEMAVLALYWWHPVVWWAQRQLREAEEQCCDAWVLWALPEAASNYAAALVETLAFLNHSRIAVPLGASGIEPMRLLKRRLSMIVQGHTSRGISRLAFWSVVGLGLLLLPLLPVPAQQTGGPEGDDEEQVQPPPGPPGTPPALPQPPASRPAPTHTSAPMRADRAEQIEAARDQVDLMEAKLMIKRAELEEIEMRIRLAQRSVSRLEELHKKGFATESALRKAQDEAELLPTQLPTKKAELKEAEIMLKQAQRRLRRLEATEVTPQGGPGMGPRPTGMPGMMGLSGPTMRPRGVPKGPGGLPPGGMPGPGGNDGKALSGAPAAGMPDKMGPSLPGAGGPMKGPAGLPGGPGVGPPPFGGLGLPAGPGVGAPQTPPSDGAEGMVLEADPTSGLVTISIGSDSGLRKGSPLYVYRLKPNPKYLGKIEIVHTQPHQAVGRLADPQRGPVEKGDLVAGMGETEGFVLEADQDTGLTTISIGTDAGVKPGSILEVYRVSAPNPKYLGRIEILEAERNRAVGRKTAAPPTNPLEKGDLVAGKLIGKGDKIPPRREPEESQKRIQELEQKVDQLMKQIDALQKELKEPPGKPRSRSSRPETIPGTGIQRSSSQSRIEEPANRN